MDRYSKIISKLTPRERSLLTVCTESKNTSVELATWQQVIMTDCIHEYQRVGQQNAPIPVRYDLKQQAARMMFLLLPEERIAYIDLVGNGMEKVLTVFCEFCAAEIENQLFVQRIKTTISVYRNDNYVYFAIK